MNGIILALNAGSSSIKFALHEHGLAAQRQILRGAIEGIGAEPRFTAWQPDGAIIDREAWADAAASHEQLLQPLLAWITARLGAAELAVVGHRVVHGGPSFGQPVRIDTPVMQELERLVPLAPLHQPHPLAAARAIARLRPGLMQVACFDTAFHRGMPAVAASLGLPRAYADDGMRRYGFHGLSYEYLAGRLREFAPELADGRVIMAHLGNGASLCALHEGRSVDASTGFSTLDGVPMGTRCGALDAGVLLYLLRQGMSLDELEDLLYHRSGLLGVSGLSADVRSLQQSQDSAAREALDLFALRCAGEAARLAATLGGIDALVFTAGIGEHDAAMRAAICERLAWLGVRLDPQANAAHAGRISRLDSAVCVYVIPTNEEQVIADDAARLLLTSTTGKPS